MCFKIAFKKHTAGIKSSKPLLLAFQAPKKAKKKEAGSSNVFSMFEQSQIQEFKEVGHF